MSGPSSLITRKIPRRPDLPPERVLPRLEELRWVKEVEVTEDAILVTCPRGVAPTESEFRSRLGRDARLYI